MDFKEFSKTTKLLYLIAILLLLPAVFIHLGLLTLWADEPTRAIVALEMMLSDNYLTSTINGGFYFNKLPLYNWLVVVFFKLFNSSSEFIVRLPSVLPFLAFGYIIYYYVKKHTQHFNIAFFSAFAFLTGGNILFFSSYQGHIDMLYSMLTFIGFMIIYEEFDKQRWYRLFIITYIITAAGFMLKGLPSFLFQAFTLLAYFTYKKQFKKLFHPAHFVGIGVMVVILGTYLWAYYTKTDFETLKTLVTTQWSQSSQRTAISEDKSFWQSISYLFKFPLINIQDLAPWSLLIVFLFSKRAIQEIKKQPFILFISLTFIVNIWVYWISPDNRPRYLFMLFPLLLAVIVYLYYQLKDDFKLLAKVVNIVFGVFVILVAIALIVPPFIKETGVLNNVALKSIALFIPSVAVVVLYFKLNKQRMVLLTISLLLMRIGFNWFIIEPRYLESSGKVQKEAAYEVARITKGEPLYVLDYTPINHNICFYIEEQRQDILRFDRDLKVEADMFYIATDNYLEGKDYRKFYTFYTDYQNTTLNLVKFNSNFDLN